MIKMKMDASFSYFLKEVQIMQPWKKSMLEVQSWGTGPQAEKARAALAKDQAVKTVVKHAAVGGVVAGPAGAVVGAIAVSYTHLTLPTILLV